MAFTLFRATLNLHTAFGTPLVGDTLFGQLCWAARELLGNEKLNTLLDGYTSGSPWAIVSDGFPCGFLPKATLPAFILSQQSTDVQERKQEKAKHWIPLTVTDKPLQQWLSVAVNDNEAFQGDRASSKFSQPIETVQAHNSLNRLTNTTGGDGFSPYTQAQTFFVPSQKIDIYCVLDEARLPAGTLLTLLQSIGNHGFGRDANIGLGKFSVESLVPFSFSQHASANAYLTLAPSAPQGQGFDGEQSYWRVLTRFGRHGNLHGISEKPFKNPILLAGSGAVFFPIEKYTLRPFIGQGIGGNRLLSKIEPATVHQGYAPVIGIHLEQ